MKIFYVDQIDFPDSQNTTQQNLIQPKQIHFLIEP